MTTGYVSSLMESGKQGGRVSRVRRAGELCRADHASAGTVVVALSGGLDSCVLLHLLRWGVGCHEGPAPSLLAAHFDHGMRDGSAADSRWVSGLCRAWSVPLVTARAHEPLESEAAARAARYSFLDRVRSGLRHEAVVLTAHHADDQAETVLFRLLRGSGTDGLRGVHERRGDLARPLLHLGRDDLAAYAAAVGLRWRQDASNEDPRFARNALRHVILPEIERTVAPGARQSLLRLARIAEGDAEAWSEVMPMVIRTLEPRGIRGGGVEGEVTVDREALLALGRPLRSRVIRSLVAPWGASPAASVVACIQDFIESSISGKRLDIGWGLVVSRNLDRITFRSSAADGSPRRGWNSVQIPRDSEGSAHGLVGGQSIQVTWSTVHEADQSTGSEAFFDMDTLAMPLEVRSRTPGDRIRLRGGSRKVKKVLLEQRIPEPRRDGVPMLVDADGEVIWIPRVARSVVARPREGAPSLRIRMEP